LVVTLAVRNARPTGSEHLLGLVGSPPARRRRHAQVQHVDDLTVTLDMTEEQAKSAVINETCFFVQYQARRTHALDATLVGWLGVTRALPRT
jgi:hypothetical protein